MTESAEKNFPAYSHLPYYDLLENIKEALDEHHIAIPYPQMDIRVAGTVPTLS